MSFRSTHPRQRRTCEEYKAELEEENNHLRSELQTEVDTNRQNKRRINQLERDYFQCEQEIQDLNGEIKRLENASEEEISELKSAISSLKNQLYQAKKDVQNKDKYISYLEKKLLESEEQVEKLRSTITELADAIDGYVDNPTTRREILAEQIKRSTRQIRQKENHLQQDIFQEQQRYYNAETERDNEIIQRQLAEGMEQKVIADLHQLWANARNQVNRMLDNITGKRTCIGVLLQEKFALQLLYQRNALHLQRYRGNIGLLEYNRDRLYERYEKWKAKEKNSCQNIFNLQGQIFALQNNPPNQINMVLSASFQLPELHSFEQDHEDYVDNFIAYINLANINDETRTRNILDRSIKGEVREWYHREFDNKNWELQNVLNNSGLDADMANIRGANVAAITGAVASFPNVLLDIRDEIFRIGQHRPIDEILDSLADIELHQGLLGPSPSYLNYTLSPPINSNIAP
ncbi:hypothetical protein RclHR1_25540002 [Rhizophagus clarus]|uniref:Uncharacterized protein n=1 Tax=Rhizophagus clarus TaxID=94130 RepID=A0A2Z6R0R7_9GLOM|nr:hypothetical protein RclHR1_25540002 [Rhizophagus clarus]